MASQAITLKLPLPLYEHFERRAARRHHSLETEILEAMNTVGPRSEELPADLARSVSALAELEDDSLWKAAQECISSEATSRLAALNQKQQGVGLTKSEKKEQTRLLEGYERIMLLRAEAAWLLKQRGHDVSSLASPR